MFFRVSEVHQSRASAPKHVLQCTPCPTYPAAFSLSCLDPPPTTADDDTKNSSTRATTYSSGADDEDPTMRRQKKRRKKTLFREKQEQTSPPYVYRYLVEGGEKAPPRGEKVGLLPVAVPQAAPTVRLARTKLDLHHNSTITEPVGGEIPEDGCLKQRSRTAAAAMAAAAAAGVEESERRPWSQQKKNLPKVQCVLRCSVFFQGSERPGSGFAGVYVLRHCLYIRI